MSIRHVITIQVAAGRAPEFAQAFAVLRAAVAGERGCEQYELFQSLTDPDRVAILERWTDQASLDRHIAAERSGDTSLTDALVALWAPGVTPVVERFEM